MGADKQTTVRIDEDLLLAVKRACLDRGRVSQTEAIDKGLRLWLGAKAPEEPSIYEGLNRNQRNLVERYANALRSSRDPEFLSIIETMLDRIERDEPPAKRKAG